jgi:plastocyanin
MKNLRNSRVHRLRRRAFALLAIITGMTFAGASAFSTLATAQAAPAAAAPASIVEVKIDNFAFSPATITVKAGTQVTWINHDDIPHTVDSTEGRFKSKALDTDDTFQFTFTAPGEYPFYCRMHPKMTGKIIVQP